MATIPLEDSFTDILGKAQRGLKFPDDQLAARVGISIDDLARVKGGEASQPLLRVLAGILGLGADALLASAAKSWYPEPVEIDGLKQFNTVYEDMTVNFYLAWDAKSK